MTLVPAQPFREWSMGEVRRQGLSRFLMDVSDARFTEDSCRKTYSYLVERTEHGYVMEHVDEELVDRWLINAASAVHLSEMYPQLYACA